MQQMNIAAAANQSFYKYLYVMLASLLENNKEQDICIYLMTADLTEEQIAKLRRFVESYGQHLCVLIIENSMFPKELPATDKITAETYFRLALVDLLPQELERILYLDVDLIVDKEISDFYFMEFNGKSFCACRGDVTSNTKQNVQESELFVQLREKPDFVYFNAGVLLMNLAKLRKTVSLEYFIHEALKVRKYLAFHDQDLLNYLFCGDVQLVEEEKYNLFARIAYNAGIDYMRVKEHTAILHYAGPKPWQHEEVRYSLERFWWEYAKKTPYYTELLEEIVLKEIDTGYMNQLFRELQQENDELKQIAARCMQLLKNG